MRLIKPMRLSITQRVITIQRQPRLVVGLLVYFPLVAPEVPLQEVKLWQGAAADILTDGVVLDECLPKARGEVLVFGTAYAPRGEATPAFPARVLVGQVDKTVAVVGPRRWRRGGPTDPEPLTELPLKWEYAFGGPAYDPNPTGMGLEEVEEGGERYRPLPQLEDPHAMIKGPDDRPVPACFGALDPTLRGRIQLMGTYGADYLQRDFPGFASDLHPDFFQAALPDQRLARGYFEGGEPIELENLHPTKAKLTSHVPRLAARLFIAQGAEDAPRTEVATHLDTVMLFPNQERGVAIFRGVHPVERDDATDVALLVAAIESSNERRSVAHYDEAIAKRMDPDNGFIHMLSDRGLVPVRPPGAPSFEEDAISDMDQLMDREGILMKRSHTRATQELEKARLSMHVLGIDPDEHLPRKVKEPQPKVSLDDLPDFIADAQREGEKMKAKLEEEHTKLRAQIAEACEVLGLDADALSKKGESSGGGPPPFRAEEQLQQMRDLLRISQLGGGSMPDLEAKLADPAFAEELHTVERRLIETYRMGAHAFPRADPLSEERQNELSVIVDASLSSDEPLAGRDLTGADLRAFDLEGVDLSNALLEGADLTGCNLAGANLAGAVLTRAHLGEANLKGADLRRANLGQAEAEGVDLSGADLRDAVLYETCLIGARLPTANLEGTMWMYVDFTEANLGEANLKTVMAYECVLERADFSRADLHRTQLVSCDALDATFDGARLERATMLQGDATGASFAEANMEGAAFVQTKLVNACLRHAWLERLNVRDVPMAGADLSEAKAPGADFSGADLSGANLEGLSARGALFMRTNLTAASLLRCDLMEGLLMHAVVDRVRFDGSNLFRANLLGARGDADTSFRDCFTKRVLFREGEAS